MQAERRDPAGTLQLRGEPDASRFPLWHAKHEERLAEAARQFSVPAACSLKSGSPAGEILEAVRSRSSPELVFTGRPIAVIEKILLLIDGQKVTLDSDLAELSGVETKMLVRSIKRNSERFPDDFMVQLTRDEVDNVKCPFGTSRWGGRRHLPYAFTESGIAMLWVLRQSP